MRLTVCIVLSLPPRQVFCVSSLILGQLTKVRGWPLAGLVGVDSLSFTDCYLSLVAVNLSAFIRESHSENKSHRKSPFPCPLKCLGRGIVRAAANGRSGCILVATPSRLALCVGGVYLVWLQPALLHSWVTFAVFGCIPASFTFAPNRYCRPSLASRRCFSIILSLRFRRIRCRLVPTLHAHLKPTV